MTTLIATWYGSFLVSDGRITRSETAPTSAVELADRARARRDGALTPEEVRLLGAEEPARWLTPDRRLADRGPRLDLRAPGEEALADSAPDRRLLRDALLLDAERALERAWDPSVHVEEAVRAATDLDRVANLVGERIGVWVALDSPDVDPGDHTRAARAAIEGRGDPKLGPTDPALAEARRQLAALFESVRSVRNALTGAVTRAAPLRTPNLSALLGPELAGRLVAQAGGLERLARLPASTVQVLGAETAFFEHLRGRAPPPRHGVLFLHPAIQGASRADRGRLARALAGKAAIAARLDRQGTPIDPSLARAFEARRGRLREARGSSSRGARPRRSRKPLDRAASDR